MTAERFIQAALQGEPEPGFLVLHGPGVMETRRELYDSIQPGLVYPFCFSWLRRRWRRNEIARTPVLMSWETIVLDIEQDKLLRKMLEGKEAKKEDWSGRLTGVIFCLAPDQEPKFRSRNLKNLARIIHCP